MATKTNQTVTREWVEQLLEAQLPRILAELKSAPNATVADFAKLAQLAQRRFPAPRPERTVEWVFQTPADTEREPR